MIIRSLLENDVYKWNMAYAIMMKYPFAETVFKFKDRNNEVFDESFIEKFNLELASLSMLRLKADEKAFLIKRFHWIPRFFFDWFETFKFKPKEQVKVWLDEEGHFNMESTALAYENEFWEVPLLAIFTELREEYVGRRAKLNMAEVLERAEAQIELSNEKQLYFSEFGLRRRFCAIVQDRVDELIAKKAKYCIGNSNVYEAFRFDQKICGTQAHSWIMLNIAFNGYRLGNYHAMENWNSVFKGNNGIYLVDTIGIDIFLNNLTMLQAKAMDGARWDSGPWETFTTKVINRWRELNVNPQHKTMMYSDSINMFQYADIDANVKGRVGFNAAGMGGTWTNNTGISGKGVQCVMKLDRARINPASPWIFCVKCPDTDGKYMGDINEVEVCLKSTGRRDLWEKHFEDKNNG